MKTIRIVNVPDGNAPLHIREQWVGVDILFPKVDEIDQRALLNYDYYIVLSTDALEALKKQGKSHAANFWSSSVLGKYLAFKKTDCIEDHKCKYTENSRPYCAECGHLIGGF